MTRALKLLAAALLITGLAGYVVSRPSPLAASRRASASADPSARDAGAEELAASAEPSVAPTRSPATGPPEQPEAMDPLDERALTAQLRALGASDPVQSIDLARRANARFPNGPDAAERAWVIVKSLTSLERFHEARAEARAMVEHYPGTSWTQDVERHTLIYPLDQPSREQQQELGREELDAQ